MEPPSLETLSPELQAQIMRNLGSVPVLFSLLHASPRLYQVFRSRREYLITQLTFNHFHPQLSDDVMELVSALQLARPADRQSVQEYLSKRDRDELDQEQPTMALSTTIPLCKIARTIAWFIQDYQRSSLDLLNKLGKDMELEQDTPVLQSDLSSTEQGRLQRAFCRFETFCCLCVAPKDKDTEDRPYHTYQMHSRRFLDGFTPDEVEEVASIRDYLIRRLWKTFEAIEEDAMEGEICDQVRKIGEACKPQDWFSYPVKACYHMLYMEYLMSQGLDFLHKVFTSDGLRRAELVIVNSTERRHFLTDALEPLFGSMASLGFGEEDYDAGKYGSEDEEFEVDDVDRFTQGLLWANKNKVPKDYARWPLKGLRDWGYVFWDSWRMKASGVLDKE
ncbi:MAG: hypothetical protein Q9166_006437 [cf. Caloplaca sp. 2 TL-2023]